MSVLCGGIEAGGTKFVCAIGSSPQDLRDEIRFETTTPTETLQRTIAYFREQQAKQPLKAIGIGSFGPVDLHPHSPTYGYITSTPKPGWANTDFAGKLQRELNVPVSFDTDVNAAALGEQRWGAAQGLENFIYLTIGTGVGGGAMVNGRLLHGLVHPEMGHIMPPRDHDNGSFPGNCPFHGDCFEGLASGPALEKRWGRESQHLQPDHPAWKLEARYIALALVNYICTLSPERLVIGGGVMKQNHLFPMIRRNVLELLNDYVMAPEITENIDSYIVPPGLGDRAGIFGAIALAREKARS